MKAKIDNAIAYLLFVGLPMGLLVVLWIDIAVSLASAPWAS